MLEQYLYPDEAWNTNFFGPLNVTSDARSAGLSVFAKISTEKTANSTSVLGQSNRVTEKIESRTAEATGFRYLSVSFVNVVERRDSMIPTFQSFFESGGPLTVTNPVCESKLHNDSFGRPVSHPGWRYRSCGRSVDPRTGEPFRIRDVAPRMIEISGKDIVFLFTGLRKGEKSHEEIVEFKENLECHFRPQISHTRTDSISPNRLDTAD
ncbi:polysaccharide biosynthesis protein [Paeniglutamicibacter sp. ZC-3]|uniref:polysaccharide biosynthesis protein n=1 Tax=Paeniglutamicibacter sp. ZC-3 TaxID=2986919 RepID=UPI0021F7A0E2|nr:polysaccharide biosynthesis protein [Paeniglutamicibacter sp. ZC-3]MCV9996517.1 polysaccharide biosynthesis protein [Paeniglutamicibacter sp. ZC-3]